jgi:hypothetical protein
MPVVIAMFVGVVLYVLIARAAMDWLRQGRQPHVSMWIAIGMAMDKRAVPVGQGLMHVSRMGPTVRIQPK